MQDLARDEEIFAAKTTETRELKALLRQAQAALDAAQVTYADVC